MIILLNYIKKIYISNEFYIMFCYYTTEYFVSFSFLFSFRCLYTRVIDRNGVQQQQLSRHAHFTSKGGFFDCKLCLPHVSTIHHYIYFLRHLALIYKQISKIGLQGFPLCPCIYYLHRNFSTVRLFTFYVSKS